MAHLTGCDSCQELWSELQKAQELALSLPSESVSHDFRDSLFERIRAGEGTPEAIFNEPVPKLVKLRYLATGAAAAAVLLFGMNLFGMLPFTEDESISNPSLANGNLVSADGLSEEFRPFNATYVAEAGADSLARTIDDLKFRTNELSRKVDSVSPRQLFSEDAQLAALLQKLRGSVGLMRSMQEQAIVSLPSRFAAELAITEAIPRQFESAESAQEFRFALDQIDRVKVEHMRDPFQVLCCQNPEEFFALYSSMVERNPDIGRVLKVVAPQGTQIQGPRPSGRTRLFLQFRVRSSGSPRATRPGRINETEDIEVEIKQKRLLKQK
jgi:hypothetical protein